jgi:hypothetical protein
MYLKLVGDGVFFEGQTNTAFPWDHYPGEWLGPIEPPRPKQEKGVPHGEDYSV